jgi:hypothetical protein
MIKGQTYQWLHDMYGVCVTACALVLLGGTAAVAFPAMASAAKLRPAVPCVGGSEPGPGRIFY